MIIKILAIFLILIPLLVMSYLILFEKFRDARQAEINKNMQMTDLTANYIDDFIASYKTILKNIATSDAVKGHDRAAITSVLENIGIVHTEASLFWVANSDGTLLAKYPNDNPDKNIADREFFRESMQGKIFTGGPYTGRVTNLEIVEISVPYYKGDKVEGVVGVSIPLSELQKKLATIQVGQTGYASLITIDGKVLCQPNLEEFRKTYSFKDSPIYKAITVSKLTKGYFDESNPNEPERKMHSYEILKEAPWIVLIIQPLAEFDYRLNQIIFRNILILIVMGFFWGFIIHYLFRLKDKNNAEKIKQAEKLAVVGELAAGIAHEIRNPLTAIKGFVQLIAQKKGPEIPDMYTDTVFEELDRIDQIVGEMLLLAKPSPVTQSKIDIAGLIQDIVNLMSPQALMHDVIINTSIESGLPSVDGVQNQLKQVFINLIKNSIEAMEQGGTVTIHACLKSEKNIITVSDTGKGIPSGQLKNIGTPFFSTKEMGTGLGLMVTYRIIQNHKGEISVQSKVGEGTVFKISLPVQ